MLAMLSVTMGLFGISEVYASAAANGDQARLKKIPLRDMMPMGDDIRRSWPAILRGSGLGSLLGVLPTVGGTIASFMAYSVEKRISKTPERFGHGAVEGITSPEAANNAADQTAFIPTLTLGIPGTPC